VLLTIGPILAVAAEFMAMVFLGSQWADNYDVWSGGGGCGWDGTCSIAGEVPVTFYGLGLLLAAEFIIGIAIGEGAWRRARMVGDHEVTAEARTATRLSVTIMLGCAAMWAVLVQSTLVDAVGSHWFGTAIARQPQMAGFDFISSTSLPAVELALGVVAWLTTKFWRQRRRVQMRPTDC
jgi:hypothetical protein